MPFLLKKNIVVCFAPRKFNSLLNWTEHAYIQPTTMFKHCELIKIKEWIANKHVSTYTDELKQNITWLCIWYIMITVSEQVT